MNRTTDWKLVALGLIVGAVGAWVLSSRPADAQVRFTECTAATMWAGRGADLATARVAQTVRIPAGWTPIGGTNRGGEPAIIICR